MNRRYFSRRAFLAATGTSAALLPLMSKVGRTQTAAPIKRFIVLAVPNGNTDKWVPTGGVTDWTISPEDDAPLKNLVARHRERLIVMGGVWLKNGWDATYVVQNHDERMFKPGSIGGHAAPPVLLTGAVGTDGPAQFDGWEMTAGGPSVDTYIAQNQPDSANVKYRPLALRATRRDSASSFISFQGKPTTPRVQNTTAIHDDPVTLFRDMFENGSLGADELSRVIAGKKHILDFVSGQLNALHNRFGSANKLRIEAHLEAVARAAKSVQVVASCQTPTAPDSKIDYLKAGIQYPAIVKSHIDLMVVAMACDLTRSSTLLLSDGANGDVTFQWLKDKDPGFDGIAPKEELGGGQIRTHHNIAHHQTGPIKNYSDQWFVDQYAYLLDRLAETTDADGRPLIETTVVLFCNMQDSGGGHGTKDLKWILGGNHDGYFKTGRFLRYAGGGKDSIPQNQIFTSVINSSGCPPVEFFGDAQYGGELSLLRG